MFKFSAKLLVTADAWDGVDTKIHLRETEYWAKKVWNSLKDRFQQLNQQYKIKGVALHEWIKEYGITALMRSQDPDVRRATNDIRKALNNLVTTTADGGQFRSNEITAFKQEFGSNVTDWLIELASGQKRGSLLRRNQK